MIKFRQKEFNRVSDAAKKVAESPITRGAVVASGPILGVANLSLNVSRKKKDTELREDQLRAMEELRKALKESNDLEIREAARHAKTSFRRKHPEDIKDDDVIIIPNPVSSIKKKFRKNDRI